VPRFNKCPNPSAANNTTGYTANSGTTITRLTGQSGPPRPTGVSIPGASSDPFGQHLGGPKTPAAAGQTWSMVAWIRSSVARSIILNISAYNAAGDYVSDFGGVSVSLAANTWTQVRVDDTISGSTIAQVAANIDLPTAVTTAHTIAMSSVRYEQINDSTLTYADGDSGGGWKWDGTAGSSTSTLPDGPPEQTITVTSSIPAPPPPGQPTVDQGTLIAPAMIPAPPAPGRPTVIPGPVDVVMAATIPAPAAPGRPNVQRTIHVAQSIPPPPPPGVPVLVQDERPPLRVDFWAVDDDGSILCPLPDFASFDLTLVPREKGAVQLDYPRAGLNFGVLDTRVTARRDLRIRIRIDGTNSSSLGALLHARDGDAISEGGTVTFSGAFLPILLGEAPLPRNPASEAGDWTYVDGTAGSILNDALTTVMADGYLADASRTFTDQADSNGVPWQFKTSAVFSPGKTILDLAQQLAAWGMCEFEVVDATGGGIEVRAYDPSSVGRDYTQADPPIVFRVGRDLTESPHRADVSDAATSLLIAGGGGIYVEVDDPTAIAERGRKVGKYLSEGNLNSQGAALAYGQLELSRSTVGVDELTHSLTFDQDQPGPLRDLLPLDKVYSDTGAGLQPIRIAQVTVSQGQNDNTYTGGITLGDLIASQEVLVQRQLDGLLGGQIITGTSTTPPDSDDGKTPAQVVGVAVDSFAYGAQDQTRAAVTTTWLAVTDNSDGSPILNLSQYEIRYRNIGAGTDYVSVPPQTDLNASWDGVAPGITIGVQVRAVNRYGRAGDWSTEAQHLTAKDDEPPPVPSAPLAENYIGLLKVDWDGLGSQGEAMPGDFDVAQVMVSTTADFDPDTDPFQIIAQFRGRQSYAWSPGTTTTTWYVKLRTIDKTGNISAPSAVASAKPGLVEEGDVGSVNVGVLTSGIMNAVIANIGTIYGGAANAHNYELSANGLFFFDQNQNQVFKGGGPDGIVEMTGKLTAGDSTNDAIIVDPAYRGPDGTGIPFPSLVLQAAGDLSAGPGSLNATWIPAKNTTAVGLNSGRSRSTGSYTQTTCYLFPDQVWLSVNTIDGRTFRGGYVDLFTTYAQIGYAPNNTRQSRLESSASGVMLYGAATDGGTESYIGVGSNGTVGISAGGAGTGPPANGIELRATGDINLFTDDTITKLKLGSDGSVLLGGRNNGYVSIDSAGNLTLSNHGISKSFVIPHPVEPDDRWLVHACIEGPTADLLYRGEAEIWDGEAVVELPGYFESASRTDGRQVQVTPVDEPYPVAASAIVDGRFTIRCDAPDGTRVSWLVTAIRADVTPFQVEPLRSDVIVHGQAPYLSITPKTGGPA
jgi:hypothetical protein